MHSCTRFVLILVRFSCYLTFKKYYYDFVENNCTFLELNSACPDYDVKMQSDQPVLLLVIFSCILRVLQAHAYDSPFDYHNSGEKYKL